MTTARVLVAALSWLMLGAAPPVDVATFSQFRYEGSQPAHARLKLPAGHYRNPIIQGSYSDPSIVRVGDDFYLTNASFTFWPGLPIFRSHDLVHWKQVGSALDRPDQIRIAGLDSWLGIYAPMLTYRDLPEMWGNFILTAPRAEGRWSHPHWLPFEGIDPSLFFDVDGRAYVVNNGPPTGPRATMATARYGCRRSTSRALR